MKSFKSIALKTLGVCLMFPLIGQASGTLKNDYLSIKDSRGEKAVISSHGTGLNQVWIDQSVAPRGSAALTSSGDLAPTGIKYVIHAASGSMGQSGEGMEPSIEGVQLSIANSIRIAQQEGIKRLAIPLIGGGIFLNSLGISKERLAYTVIETARAQKANLELIFVAYSEDDTAAMQTALDTMEQRQKEDMGWLTRLWNSLKSFFGAKTDFFEHAELVRGSITDYNLHKAEAIVNAANMELTFGGGLSGVIGRATNDSEHIDQVGQELIKALYQAQ
ncbi:RNase III inhibitor [compost metagenome]